MRFLFSSKNKYNSKYINPSLNLYEIDESKNKKFIIGYFSDNEQLRIIAIKMARDLFKTGRYKKIILEYSLYNHKISKYIFKSEIFSIGEVT